MFLDILFEAHPNIKVIQFGYDLFDFTDNNIECTAMGRAIFQGYCREGLKRNITCENHLFASIQQTVESLAKTYDNMYSVDLLGTMQYYAGIKGAAIGSPNWSVPSPKKFMRSNCIHLTEEGY